MPGIDGYSTIGYPPAFIAKQELKEMTALCPKPTVATYSHPKYRNRDNTGKRTSTIPIYKKRSMQHSQTLFYFNSTKTIQNGHFLDCR